MGSQDIATLRHQRMLINLYNRIQYIAKWTQQGKMKQSWSYTSFRKKSKGFSFTLVLEIVKTSFEGCQSGNGGYQGQTTYRPYTEIQ